MFLGPENRPGGHAVGAVDRAGQAEPAGHGIEVDDREPIGQKNPATQSTKQSVIVTRLTLTCQQGSANKQITQMDTKMTPADVQNGCD